MSSVCSYGTCKHLLAEGNLVLQACVPPRAPAERVALAIRVRREPVYVAGRYLKLQRCDKACVHCYSLGNSQYALGLLAWCESHDGFVSPGLSHNMHFVSLLTSARQWVIIILPNERTRERLT